MTSGTLIGYYFVCHRKLWLHANNIRMEHTSETVYEGKLISETSYPQRAKKYTELEIGPVKIDHYDPKNKIIHEVKKSSKVEQAHEWQLKYYLWILEKAGIEGAEGILEYPKLRQTKRVSLESQDRHYLQETVRKIEALVSQPHCPPLLHKPICQKCSYYEFCYSDDA